MLLHLEKENFDEEIKQGLVLVDFFATWCGPCKMLGPELEKISTERSLIKIIKVDIDRHSDLANKFGIMSVPTLLFIKNGEIKHTTSGYMPKEVILDIFSKL